ncbi:MAG: helix-turn-helix domain-containing protein [Candidatus Hodarchaeota archaeon]
MNKKLTESQIEVMKYDFENGESISEIARTFEVSRKTVYNYINEKNWKRKKKSFFQKLKSLFK